MVKRLPGLQEELGQLNKPASAMAALLAAIPDQLNTVRGLNLRKSELTFARQQVSQKCYIFLDVAKL